MAKNMVLQIFLACVLAGLAHSLPRLVVTNAGDTDLVKSVEEILETTTEEDVEQPFFSVSTTDKSSQAPASSTSTHKPPSASTTMVPQPPANVTTKEPQPTHDATTKEPEPTVAVTTKEPQPTAAETTQKPQSTPTATTKEPTSTSFTTTTEHEAPTTTFEDEGSGETEEGYTCAADNNPCDGQPGTCNYHFAHQKAAMFVQCNQWGTQCFEMHCQPGLEWSHSRCACDWPSAIGSDEDEGEDQEDSEEGEDQDTPEPFKCSANGHFPDPADCGSYFVCEYYGTIWARHHHLQCPLGLVFNEVVKYCDHIYNVPRCQ